MEKVTCHVSGSHLNGNECYYGGNIREPVFKLIQKDYPDFTKEGYISKIELNKYRKKYLSKIISEESGELNILDKQVIEAISSNSLLSENIEPDIIETLTIGQRMADKIASFGGSWRFIISFFLFILIWIIINIWLLATRVFDPYPFILLNLILSCLAAIQAPIIMMSQNRQEQKDRKRSEHNYKINLKAELEIKLLHEKMDHLLVQQYQRLLEIQELQTDFLQDIIQEIRK